MLDPRQLIARAYEDARLAGKPDWRFMTSAVLKNRLLDLTDREFAEGRYGASNFMGFISRYPEMLRIDDSQFFPPIVEFYDSQSDGQSSEDSDAQPTAYHIRSDLWQAVLDYSSGARYVWDDENEEARPSLGSENYLEIDTVTADLQREWRRKFLSENTKSLDLTNPEIQDTEEWIQQYLGTSRLPTRLVPHWNSFFRDMVLTFIRNWFSSSGLKSPDDLVLPVRRGYSIKASETEELREFVISAARLMTDKELSELKLPSKVLLRVSKRTSR